MLDNFDNEDDGEWDDFFDEEEIATALEKFKLWKEHGTVYFTEEEIEALSYHFFVEGKRNEQMEILEHGMMLYPNNVDLMIEKANYHAMKNEHEEALDILNKAKIIAPYDPAVANLEGVVLTELKNFDEAEEAFDRAIENCTDDDDLEIEICINFAQSLCLNGNNDKAVTVIEKGIKAYPKNSMLYNQLGLCFVEDGDFKHAIAYFKRKIDEDPFNDQYWHQYGKYLEIAGQDAAALNAYEYAGLINEKADNSFFSRAGILENREEYNKAIECYKQCIRSDGDVYPYICIARCYVALEDTNLARFYLKKAQYYGDFIPEYQYLLGYSFLLDNEALKALPYFKRLLKVDEKDFASYKAMLACYSNLGKRKELEAAIKKIKKNNREIYYDNWRSIGALFYLSGYSDMFDELLEEVKQQKVYDNEIEIVLTVISYNNLPNLTHKEDLVNCLIENFEDTVDCFKLYCPELYTTDDFFKLNYNLYKKDNNDE